MKGFFEITESDQGTFRVPAEWIPDDPRDSRVPDEAPGRWIGWLPDGTRLEKGRLPANVRFVLEDDENLL